MAPRPASCRQLIVALAAFAAASLGGPALAQSNWRLPEPVLGVGSAEPPGAALGGPHGVDIVHTGSNRHLYWQWKSAGQYLLPGDLNTVGATSAPSLVAGGRHLLDAFYRGRNGHLWTSWWDGTWWSAPADLGGVMLGSAPTAVRDGPHRLDVFYLDDMGKLRQSHWDGGTWWSAPGEFPITSIKGPVGVVTNGPHKVEVFYRTSNDRLMRFWSDGGPWSAPEAMQTVVTSNPSGVYDPARKLAVMFYRNAQYLCYQSSLNRGPWVNACTNIKVGGKLAAITVDEVFVKGEQTPFGPSPTATSRVWRD